MSFSDAVDWVATWAVPGTPVMAEAAAAAGGATTANKLATAAAGGALRAAKFRVEHGWGVAAHLGAPVVPVVDAGGNVVYVPPYPEMPVVGGGTATACTFHMVDGWKGPPGSDPWYTSGMDYSAYAEKVLLLPSTRVHAGGRPAAVVVVATPPPTLSFTGFVTTHTVGRPAGAAPARPWLLTASPPNVSVCTTAEIAVSPTAMLEGSSRLPSPGEQGVEPHVECAPAPLTPPPSPPSPAWPSVNVHPPSPPHRVPPPLPPPVVVTSVPLTNDRPWGNYHPALAPREGLEARRVVATVQVQVVEEEAEPHGGDKGGVRRLAHKKWTRGRRGDSPPREAGLPGAVVEG